MIEIKDLLGRFDKLLLSGEGRVNSVREAISGVIGVEINPKDITIKNNTIYLNIKSIYKNEILLKQELIFSKLQETLGRKSPEEIR